MPTSTGTCLQRCVLALVMLTRVGSASPVAPYVNQGSVAAVAELIERRLPGASAHFELSFADTCEGSTPPCFSLADGADGVVKLSATGAAELASGVGYYLRNYCNMTIGWPRGGGGALGCTGAHTTVSLRCAIA